MTARQVLRIFPDAPLTPELVERAHSAESSARHPSLYEDPAQRQEAEQWAQTLASARQVLLYAAATTPDAATAPPLRRGLSGGAIAGIVAGAAAVLALFTFGIIGAVTLVGNATTVAQEAIERFEQEGASDDASGALDVERFESSETFFTFPAALEFYMDGRYDARCSLEYAEGCWQSALFTESDCATLLVELGFSNDADEFEPETTEQLAIDDAVAGDPTPVVFGNDDYAYGWINQVTCAGSP
jgi:hypothetical protein